MWSQVIGVVIFKIDIKEHFVVVGGMIYGPPFLKIILCKIVVIISMSPAIFDMAGEQNSLSKNFKRG